MTDFTLYSRRLIYRVMEPADLQAYYEVVKSDEVGKWLASGRGKTESEALAKIVSYQESFKINGYGAWGVWEKNSDRLIGQAGLLRTDDQEVELLYALSPEFWYLGYGRECALRMLEFGFEICGLSEIIAYARPDNERSFKVLEKCGLKFIGIRNYRGVEMHYYVIKKEKWLDEKISNQY